MPHEATPWGAEISWGPFLVQYGGTYHELFLPGGVFSLFYDVTLAKKSGRSGSSLEKWYARRRGTPSSSCSGTSSRPGGIAGKIPPAPLTIGGCPYRILAGMAPGHNWGGA